MGLHDNIPSFMNELKTLPKGSPERGKFVTANMSHPPFVSAIQAHKDGKQIHSTLMGFLNSKQNAGPQGAKVSVSKSEAIEKSEAELAILEIKTKIQEFSTQIKEIRDRELNKSIIPTHLHTGGTAASGAIEDVPHAKVNPPGMNKTNKTEELAMAQKCMKCGEMHEPMKKCGSIMKAKKSELVDEKGKLSSNSVNTPFKEGDKAPKIEASGSGGAISLGKLRDNASKSMSKAEPAKTPSKAMSGHLPTKPKIPFKESQGGAMAKAGVAPPMAKPPSGVNMSTKVPTSAPKPPAMPKMPTMKGEDKDADLVTIPMGPGKGPEKKYKIPPPPKEVKKSIKKAEPLSKPAVSEAQRKAMGAAASGNSTLGIPKKVGKEFIDADKGGKLPAKMKKGLLSTAAQHADPVSAQHSDILGHKDKVKLPGAHLQAARANALSNPTDFQPKGPINSGLELDIKPKTQKPGIFGKLNKPKI